MIGNKRKGPKEQEKKSEVSNHDNEKKMKIDRKRENWREKVGETERDRGRERQRDTQKDIESVIALLEDQEEKTLAKRFCCSFWLKCGFSNI